MKNLKPTTNKTALTVLLFSIVSSISYAQKLLNVQQISVRAPATLKIDGKAGEWDGQLQAYNKATDIFYTMANDNENLYLIVQAEKPRIIQKILTVGLTLMVNNSGKKNDNAAGNIAITYPLVGRNYLLSILNNAGDKIAYKPRGMRDEVLTRTDSTVAIANKTYNANSTTIKVKGVNDLADTLISVYNEQHIKVAAAFDNKGVFTYELAVPLKFLGLSIADLQKFNYNIKLNSQRIEQRGLGYTVTFDYSHGDPVSTDLDQDLDTTTDFWGEYTLAKK